jgi:5'-deoxynucleotidase
LCAIGKHRFLREDVNPFDTASRPRLPMAALPITPSPFYAHLSRLRFIKRWGLMRNAVEEDVAQHSWDVAVLAHALAVISRDVFGQAVDPHAVATRALFHDAAEAITGDLPTPVKYSPAMRHATANLEGQVCNEMLNLLPPVLLPALRSVMDDHSWPPEEARLIKSADRLAAWLKCRAELRYGNREFEQATQQVRAKIEEHMSPEVRYFLDTFGPAFELTLDSLMQGA